MGVGERGGKRRNRRNANVPRDGRARVAESARAGIYGSRGGMLKFPIF